MDECIANICCAPDLAKSTVCIIRDNAENTVFSSVHQHLTAGIPDNIQEEVAFVMIYPNPYLFHCCGNIIFYLHSISQVDLVLRPTLTRACVCMVAHTYCEMHLSFFRLERWNNLEPKFSCCFKICAGLITCLSIRRICCIRRMKNS